MIVSLLWAILSLVKAQIYKLIYAKSHSSSNWTRQKSTNREVRVEEIKLKRSKVTVSYYYVESTRNDQFKRYGVILHDFPDSPRTWSTVLERLDPDYTFFCPNLNIETSNITQVCIELIEELCDRQTVFLVGSGMGAILTWAILQNRPNLATKVVIISEGYRTSLRRLNSAENLIKAGFTRLFQLDNFHLLRRYLQKRQINEFELEDIINDIKVKDDLDGKFNYDYAISRTHLARLYYWRQINKVRYSKSKNKIQSPVLALVGNTDPGKISL